MSGVFGVRGGFDSHAFPPWLTLVAALVMALPPGARAQAPATAARDSAVTPAPVPAPARVTAGRDSAAVTPSAPTAAMGDSTAITAPTTGTGRSPAPAAPDTGLYKIVEVGRRRPAATRPPVKLTGFEQPRWVMFRSLVVPGWGQLHNGSWLKAVGVAGAEIALIGGLVDDERRLDRLSRQVDEAQAANDPDRFSAAVNAYNARLSESVNRRWLLGGLLAYALVDAYVDAHFRNFDVEFDTDPALPEGAGPPDGGKLSLRWSF